MMNLKEAVKNYVTNMIKSNSESMKVLIFDDETLKIVNAVFSMSELMKYEVYLCEKLSLKREKLPYLNCICFLRPTITNVNLLEKELRSPNYKSYQLYFSHSIAKQQLKVLAEADQLELVKGVYECFADFRPVDNFLWHVGLDRVLISGEWQLKSLGRCVESVTSLLLALKLCPEIRYQNSSEAARRLAEQVRAHVSREAALYEFRQTRGSLLLILDRRIDPVTPLLNQWTYQAMIHELLAVDDGCVCVTETSEGSSGSTQINLDADRDDFYRQNLYSNYGEVCTNVKCAMEQLQVKSKSQEKMDSIEDMKRFIETYPSFKKLSTKISQHVLLISEISRLVGANKLLSVSECEQSMVNSQLMDGHATSLQTIKSLLSDTQLKKHDALRLVLLYGLRYDKHPRKETSNLMTLLIRNCGVSEVEIQSVRMVMEYSSIKAPDLFKDRTAATSLGLASNLFKSIKGVENIYTQHQPYVSGLVEQMSQGKLKEASFPALGGAAASGQRAADVIVFVIGGITYEEALFVHTANQQIQGMNFVLGGTQMLNYRTFLAEVASWAGESFSLDKF